MAETERLYYDSPYMTEWRTEVSGTITRQDGQYVLLAQTAFYPHGGGQPCDTGTIGGEPVLDVITEEGEVLHKVAQLPGAGTQECRIDWSRRYDHMQQHSGQHLLSAICRNLFGAMTVSFHLGADTCTIDVEKPDLTIDELEKLEIAVNQHIYTNHAIRSTFVSAEEAANLELVKQPKVTDRIRIVEMENVEHNACGGTHVCSTGELGMIKLLRTEKMKGNTRIHFKCGARALAEAQENQRIISALTTALKTNKGSLLDRFEKGELEQKRLLEDAAILRDKIDQFFVRELLASHQDKSSGNGDLQTTADSGIISIVLDDRPLKEAQNLAHLLTAESDAVVLIALTAENKVMLAHGGNREFSCGAFFKEHLSRFGGKGGGSDKMAQAGFSTWDEAERFYRFAETQLQ
ncbi:alanyl-tRNA editing protein [Gorillibacterium massiliense]|uniref:alanyl-tRNA editing protein n=1 Tax=Gorillibacterium massiliense TaxID=1280390 RepID=UPI0004B03E33|nr:alanyl-tRNA editing protein [Gorillibacterium massiliense]